MPTTFYLSQTNSGASVPVTEASTQWPNGWFFSLASPNKYLASVIGANGSGSALNWESPPTINHIDTLIAKFVSDPLAAQTLGNGTWTFGCGPVEANAAANARMGFSLQVWRPSTNTLVGYIYDTHIQLGNEWSTAITGAGRVMTFVGANVTASVGDVLVLEVWCHQATQDNATARAMSYPFGGGTVPTEGSNITYANIANYLTAPANVTLYTPAAVIGDPDKIGLINYGCTGILTIRWGDGGGLHDLAMNCPAWDIPDLTPLFVEYSVRGQDRRVPGVAGVVAYKRRMDVTEHSLGMWITGDVDRLGVVQANPRAGLEQNLKYLRDTILNPDVQVGMPANGTRYAALVTRSGAVMTTNIHVLGMRVSEVMGADAHAWVNAVLQISIPTGTFVYP